MLRRSGRVVGRACRARVGSTADSLSHADYAAWAGRSRRTAISGPVPAPAAAPAWDPYADQGLAAPAPTYPPAGATPYAAPPAYGAPGPYAQPYGAPSPYYAPPPATPGYIYPEGGPTYAGPGWPTGNPLNTIGGWTRFFQEARLEETYMFDNGSHKVAFNDIQTSATFAIPPGWTTNPILVTPGFGLWLWDGPPTATSNGADLPGADLRRLSRHGLGPAVLALVQCGTRRPRRRLQRLSYFQHAQHSRDGPRSRRDQLQPHAAIQARRGLHRPLAHQALAGRRRDLDA